MTETTRISYDVRRAPRERLIAELLDFATDRTSHGKHQRAAGARAAAATLEAGADRAQFEQTVYIVDEEPARGAARRGTRDWVLAELRESVQGWTHFGNRALALEAHAAVEEVESGAVRVRVGHIEYEISPEA